MEQTLRLNIILKYFQIFKINTSSQTVYLTNLFFQSVTVLFRIWIFAQLYKVTYDYTHQTEIGGLTVAMVVWSLTFVQSFSVATRPFLGMSIEEDVRSGAIAYYLNKPYSYLLFQLSSYFGKILPKLIVNLVIAAFFTVILVGYIKFTVIGILAGVLLLFFGYILDFAMAFIIGIASFWFEDTSSLRWIYSKGGFVFGGVIVPLSLFPDNVRVLVESLPFAQIFYGSARMIVNFDPQLFIRFFATQLIWVAVFLFLANWIFKKGAKNVAVNGG